MNHWAYCLKEGFFLEKEVVSQTQDDITGEIIDESIKYCIKNRQDEPNAEAVQQVEAVHPMEVVQQEGERAIVDEVQNVDRVQNVDEVQAMEDVVDIEPIDNIREIANISTLFNYKEQTLYISGLYTDDEFRGQGIGTFLLRYVAVEGSNVTPNPILTISLDDMSDNARMRAYNIYLKVGFRPETDIFSPERIAEVADVQSKSGWRYFCNHYINNPNKPPNLVFENNPNCPCRTLFRT